MVTLTIIRTPSPKNGIGTPGSVEIIWSWMAV